MPAGGGAAVSPAAAPDLPGKSLAHDLGGVTACCCCFLAAVTFLGFFIPGILIHNEQVAAAMGISAELGADGGLTKFTTTPCTVAAVYHTNTVSRQLAHIHHPHNPKRAGRLGEAQPVRLVYDFAPPTPPARHEHTPRKPPVGAAVRTLDATTITTSLPAMASTPPQAAPKGPAPHPHSPTQVVKGSLTFDDGSTYEGEYTTVPGAEVDMFHGAGVYTDADGDRIEGVFESGEFVCDKCAARRRGRSLSHWRRHWIDTCYDRFAMAFAPGGGYENRGSLETLAQMDIRMAGAGYAKLDSSAPSPDGSTPVILSAPLSRARDCDFVYDEQGYDGPTLGGYSRWGGAYNMSGSGLVYTYAPPAQTPTCSATDMMTYYTNAPNNIILDDDTGTDTGTMQTSQYTQWDLDEPSPLVVDTFHLQAPTEWELVKWGAGWLMSMELTQVPPKLVSNSGECTIPDLFSTTMTDGCLTREKPNWAGGCAMTVGDTVPCWWLNPSSGMNAATRDSIKREHGCKGTSTSALMTSGAGIPVGPHDSSTRLSFIMSRRAGAGPPNPDCMTIFPPSWRTKDYFVYALLAQKGGFNPRGPLMASIIMPPILLCLGMCACAKYCQARQKWKEEVKHIMAVSGASMTTSVSTSSSAAQRVV